MKSEVLTLCLARRFAILENRNQQAAMIAAARQLRKEATGETFKRLGDFITATPAERQLIVSEIERIYV